jgi:hypothetical protein
LIATENENCIQFSQEIFNVTKSEIRMIVENSYRILHQNHREIRQTVVESFITWLVSTSKRGTFALMVFTKNKNGILCEKENLQLNRTHLI